MTLTGIVLVQVANVFACRSERLSIIKLGWLSNTLILWGITLELVLLAIITYTPMGNAIFGTSQLPLWIFGPLAFGAVLLLALEEMRKLLASRLRDRSFSEYSLRGS